MFSNSKLQTAVRLALGVGAGTFAAAYSPGALAQQGADDMVEEIITTGSRIKRADLESASPVTVINREDILATGLTDVGNLIQRMPSMSGSPIGTTTNNGGNGSVQIDLRGMGVDRTVTLVNGKRVVDGGDYQTIPAQMIERVEVLKDGASAVYGADAVAGVVNIITRQDFEGISIDIQQADWFDMDDGAQQSIGIIAGKKWERGNFVFGAEFVDQSQAYQSDAPWDYFQDSYYIYPEGCEAQVTAAYDGTPSGGCYPIGSSRIPESRLNSAELTQRFVNPLEPRLYDWFNDEVSVLPGNVPNPAFDPAYGVPTFSNGNTWMNPGTGIEKYDGRTYNYAPVNYIQTPYQRTNIFAEANFDVTDTVRFYSSIRANFRESAQELAPQPYNSPTDPAYQGTWQQIDPITGEDLLQAEGVDANGDTVFYYTDDPSIGDPVPPVNYAGISEDNYYNTLGYPVRDARRRMVETNRRFTQSITQVQWVAGLSGSFNEIDWDVYYNKGYRSRVDNDFGQFSGVRLADAMGPSADLDDDGSPECYKDITDESSIIAGCVPFNFFGGPNSVTEEMLNYVGVDLVDTIVQEQDEAAFTLSGAAFDLPGGELGWAAGVGYQAYTYEYRPDSGKQLDAVTGNTGVGTKGALRDTNFFGEFLAPLYDNGTQELLLKGGVRYDDYNAFDAETTWQAGVEFQAIESLKLRGTYGTVFRAPTITDLYAGQSDNFPTYSDPCIPAAGETLAPGCAQEGVQLDSQLLARVGGNELLIPETGDTFTAGAVWQPEFGDNDISVTVDYWQVQLEDGISSLGVQFILEDCYERQVQASCDLITRRADYSIAQVIDGNLNVAEQGAKGVDTEVRWGFDTEFGQFETALLWSHLMERTKTASSVSDEEDLSGRYTDPTAEDGGAYATDKLNYSVQWYRNNLSVGYLGEFISALDADTFCNCGDGNRPDGSYVQSIDSLLYHDLVASYEFTQTGTKIAAGVTNLTDEEPPYIEVGFNATTDPATYRLFGRGYYIRLTQSFE